MSDTVSNSSKHLFYYPCICIYCICVKWEGIQSVKSSTQAMVCEFSFVQLLNVLKKQRPKEKKNTDYLQQSKSRHEAERNPLNSPLFFFHLL